MGEMAVQERDKGQHQCSPNSLGFYSLEPDVGNKRLLQSRKRELGATELEQKRLRAAQLKLDGNRRRGGSRTPASCTRTDCGPDR